MKKFEISETFIKDLFYIRRNIISDERGYFERIFSKDLFRDVGFDKDIKDINHTLTKNKNTIRGLHYQKPPFSEFKIITCLKGEVMDVAVDIRKNSPTFGKYFSIKLSSRDKNMICIPEGFAHGFQTLTNNCEMLYLHSCEYKKEYEDGINPHDKSLSISWPMENSYMSQRDSNLPHLDKNYSEIEINEM